MSGASVTTSTEDAVAGAFGLGMDYFMANEEEQRKIAANATTLEEDEWRTLTSRMSSVYEAELVGIADLQNSDLTRNISLATKVDLWQQRTGVTEADVSMDGETAGEEDRLEFATTGVPVPIVHKDFRISDRDLRSSRTMGNDLRTDTIAEATRVVTEKLEEILFDGWGPNVADARGDDFELYGYTNHPDRETFTGVDWTGAAADIRGDIVTFLDRMDDNNRTGGGFWLYLAPVQYRALRSQVDPDGDGNLTVRERINNEFGAELGRIRRAEMLDAGEAVMVDPSMDVVELAVAEDVQTIEWQSGSGMTNHYKVMASMAPELKSDIDAQSGLVHATGLGT